MGTTVVAAALRNAGVRVEIHLDHFAQDAEDEVWLPIVGKRGWLVITKDKGIRRRPAEVAKHLQFGVRSFALTSGNMRGDEMAQAILAALPSMRKLIEKTPAPFVATISASGSVTLLATVSELQRKAKEKYH